MSAGQRIDEAIEADPAAIAALLHRARHELDITRNFGGEAILDLREMLRAGSIDAALHLDEQDLEWIPRMEDAPTTGDTLRFVARRIVERGSEVAGIDGKVMARLSLRLVADPTSWLDGRLGMLIRARSIALASASGQATNRSS